MAEAGFARVRERFSVDRMVEETLAVYAAVAGTTPAAGTANPANGRLKPHWSRMPTWQSAKS